MEIKIGSAPDSWGVWFAEDEKQIPWDHFLDEIQEAGYEWTELGPYGYLPTDLSILQKELEQRHLSVTGGFVMAQIENPDSWPELERQLLGAGELLAALGANHLVLIDGTYSDPWTGEMHSPKQLDEDAWQRFIDTANRVAEIATNRFGLRLVFHPHAETHVEYEDQIERFLSQTDPELVAVCFDTGHHAYRGGDPIAFMRKHHERIPYLHLKSVDSEVVQKVEAEEITFGPAVGMGIFCEPALGSVDFIAFREVLQEIGFSGFAIVEQDMYPVPFDQPLPIAKRTREYLREIGVG